MQVFKEDGELAPVYLSQQVWTIQVGPTCSSFKDSGRVEALQQLMKRLFALLTWARQKELFQRSKARMQLQKQSNAHQKLSSDEIIIINVSGRGDTT